MRVLYGVCVYYIGVCMYAAEAHCAVLAHLYACAMRHCHRNRNADEGKNVNGGLCVYQWPWTTRCRHAIRFSKGVFYILLCNR